MRKNIQADHMLNVKSSPSVAARALVESLRERGRKVISLTIGEPDFDTPSHISDAAFKAVQEGQTHYTGVNGVKEFQRAIINKFARENNLIVEKENIAIGCGAKQLIYSAFAASLNHGDEVLIPSPYWVSYPDIVLLHGGTPVIVPSKAKDGFKLTPESLRRAITNKTKWLILNTPNNPSGAIYSKNELELLFKVLKDYPNVWVMTDEIYEHFVYDQAKFISPASIDDEIAKRCLTINGVSKAYAMTGWRIGYCCGPIEIIKAIKVILSQSTTCASSVSQAAATEALNGSQQFVSNLSQIFEKRRNRITELLNSIDGFECNKPDGAFYVFPKIKSLYNKTTPQGAVIQSDIDLADYLAEAAGVATIAGTSFGMQGHIRCSFAASTDELEEASLAIKEACKKLK